MCVLGQILRDLSFGILGKIDPPILGQGGLLYSTGKNDPPTSPCNPDFCWVVFCCCVGGLVVCVGVCVGVVVVLLLVWCVLLVLLCGVGGVLCGVGCDSSQDMGQGV